MAESTRFEKRTVMSATSESPVTERQILLVGPYGVLGTGVIDAVAENPKWGITTAAHRPAPAYRAQAAPPHISVDLMDREGRTKTFSSLDKVTDLGGSSPDFAICASSPNGPACVASGAAMNA